ncbi:hypothetical protein BFC19_12255 (plasmid) [Brochothrix thermosphacta]|uniref:hypothetical protein n=1 Tax=Brochothrix thermosphacta TaxID=2756 RepID=UPI000E735C8B|nr:hypothetical protein [Brochothrix thermosphacta]ANZ96208.1 hypothetical protein BFC19_12255 [Brochothrix thermosphacta]
MATDLINVLKKLWFYLLYFMITIFFCYQLTKLNKNLLEHFSSDAYLDIIAYNNYQSLNFFALSIFLCFIGVLMIILTFKNMYFFTEETATMIGVIVCVLITIVLMITIIILINNPILKAILSLGVGSALIGYLVANNK